jgi:hypothetical protein
MGWKMELRNKLRDRKPIREITSEHFLNLRRDVNIQVQETFITLNIHDHILLYLKCKDYRSKKKYCKL